MPIMYVNPARGPRKRRIVKKRVVRKPKRRKTTMAKAKRSPTKRRKNVTRRPSKKKTATRRRRRRNPTKKRCLAAKKAARTRARNKQRRSLIAQKAAAKRRAKSKRYAKRRSNPTKSRRRTAATKATPSRRRRTRRSNPAKAAYTRRYGRTRRRRNPAENGSIMSIMKNHVIPVAASLYVARLVSGKLASRVPGLDRIPEQFRSSALAAALLAGGHFATKKVSQLKKYRTGVLTGLGINLIDKVLGSFAPENVKSMFGVSNYNEDIYGPSLEDYVAVDDYVQIGATPIEDDITLADYVQIGEDGALEEDLGAIEQDLGVLEQDLGVEMDLGDFANRRLGGVSRSSMAAPIGHKRYQAPVPVRSFTKTVPSFGEGFDKPSKLYTGIFGGGFGS